MHHIIRSRDAAFFTCSNDLLPFPPPARVMGTIRRKRMEILKGVSRRNIQHCMNLIYDESTINYNPAKHTEVINLLHESEVIGLRSMLKMGILVNHQRDDFILNTHRMINRQLTHNGGKYALPPQHIHEKICSTLNTWIEKETMANWRRDVFCITPAMIHHDYNTHSSHRRRR